MRVIIQRSNESKVLVDNKAVGNITKGMVILVGFTDGDSSQDIDYIVNKIINLRIFDDEFGNLNKSIIDIDGEVLSISQFTLYANTKKGNRPSFINALKSEDAIVLYDEFNKKLSEYLPVKTGKFGANMQLFINNDGPVTITIDSKNK